MQASRELRRIPGGARGPIARSTFRGPLHESGGAGPEACRQERRGYSGVNVVLVTEAPSHSGHQLPGTSIRQARLGEIRNVAEANPGFGIGSPHGPNAARVAE